MGDPQTLASPHPKPLEPSPMAAVSSTPASPAASTKKKKRKNKSSEEREVAAAATTDTAMADPDPSSASTKEKKGKKNKDKKKKSSDEREAAVAAEKEKEVEGNTKEREAVTATPEKKNKNKKNKNKKRKTEPEPEPIKVTVDVSGSAAAAAAPPVVAYFPSGYNPLAAGREPPSARLFRNTKHPSRVDFVVRSPGGGPDFVGKSYDGEAALPQLCNYALGVLDKASGTIKVVPIASDKILRLEPYLEMPKPAHAQHSGVTEETAGSAVGTGEMKVQQTTSAYGTKKDKDKDKKWKSLFEQRNDPSAYMDLDFGKPETNASTSDNQAPVIVRNIPPYNPTADTSETAYRFDEIIPKNIRSHLLEILGHLESGEISSKGYGTFVSKRVHKLEKLQGEEKERLAWILSYITHLLTLFARSSSMSRRYKKAEQTDKAPAVPPAVYRMLLVMFTEEGSGTLSTEKKELLINYILVLTLFADDFRSDPEDIAADLKMTRAMLKPYYQQLGCKSVSIGAFKAHVMTLPAPLNFPTEHVRRRKRK